MTFKPKPLIANKQYPPARPGELPPQHEPLKPADRGSEQACPRDPTHVDAEVRAPERRR